MQLSAIIYYKLFIVTISNISTAVIPNIQQQQPFYGPLSGTTRVSLYQKKHSPTHHPDHYPNFISFFHLPRSIASSLFKLRAWQSFCMTSLHNHFTALCPGLPGWACTRRNTHPPTIVIIIQTLSASSIYYDPLPVQTACLAIFFHNLSSRPLWSTSSSGAIFHKT